MSEPSSPVSVAESAASFYSTLTRTSSVSTFSSAAHSPSTVPRSVSAAFSAVEPHLLDAPRCPIPETKAGLHFHDRVQGRSLYHHPSNSVSTAEAVNRLFQALAFCVLSTLLHPTDVLGKWADITAAWDGFHVPKVAGYGAEDIRRLLSDKRLIRDRVKVEALVHNARILHQLETRQPGAFLQLLWAPHTQKQRPFPPGERLLPLPSASTTGASLEAVEAVDFSKKSTACQVADGVTPTAAIFALKATLRQLKMKRMAEDGCLLFAQISGLVNHHQRSCFAWQPCEDEYRQVLDTRQAQRQ